MQDLNGDRPSCNKVAGPGPGRASTSCSECQRRKQKLHRSKYLHRQCDKTWPCRHCQERRVPHLCQFKKRPQDHKSDTPTSKSADPPQQPAVAPKRKISEIEHPDERAIAYARRYYHLDSDLKTLGFFRSGRNQSFKSLVSDALNHGGKELDGTECSDRKGQADSFPPRPYADVLIHNFLDNINFVYCICHAESLLQEYDEWWNTRRTKPNLELEGLLFRLMAISAQFLPERIVERLESEMCEDIVTLKENWHEAAEKLHRGMRPGQGGIKHVQQLMLTASYYKTEAMFIESWHALSSAIRTAQEIDMHRDSKGCDITEFEREIRRQVWYSLYCWDRLMAFLFDRPPIIHGPRTILIEPNLELHKDPIHPNLPSPVLNRIQEYRLARIVDKYLDVDLIDADVRQIVAPLKDVKEWLANLPAIFRVTNPDTSYDKQHPRIKHSRLGLHTTAYSMLFHLLQPCLVDEAFPRGASPDEREHLRDACMEYSIRLTDVVDRLTRFASHSRFHMSFCLFETSATVCAALVKDMQRKLPKRPQVLLSLGRARNILDRLGSNTAVARSSAKVLHELLSKLVTEQPDTGDLIMEGQSAPLQMDHTIPVGDFEELDSALGSSLDNTPEDEGNNGGGSGGEEYDEADVFPRVVDFVPSNSEDPFDDMGLAAIDQLWNWEDIDFDLPVLVDMPLDVAGEMPS